MNNRKLINENESVAPYNFVTLYENFIERYKSKDELPTHQKFEEGCLNGYIDYVIKAESPLMISAGIDKENNPDRVHEFFKDISGKYAIPGSTMRGLIRNNVQILGVGNPYDDISDSLFLYRALADQNSKLKSEYCNAIDITPKNNMSGKEDKMPGKVRAGYIYCDGEDIYKIIPAKSYKGRTFYRIRETDLRRVDKNHVDINYMYDKEILNFKFDIKDKGHQKWYEFLNRHFIGWKNYKPYFTEVTYDAKYLDNEGIKLERIDKKNANLPKRGFLLCSGFMNKKVSHYLVNEMDEDAEPIVLSKEEVRAYQDDLVRKKYTVEDKEFYHLPRVGIEKAKPVFYAEGGKRHYFGFTPYLRIYYNHTVRCGIPQGLKRKGIDYSKALFGFSDKENSYKGRLSFEDAVISKASTVLPEVSMVLQEPKPTCYPDYIMQNGTEPKRRKTYNDEDFRIRGIKQYWLKKGIMHGGKNIRENVATTFRPLDAGAEFKGRIYFNNLYKDELGLLLWSLKLKDGCFLNIGLAKPYGYGKISIKDIKLKIEDLDKKYSSFTFDYYKDDEDIDGYIRFYKEYVKNKKGIDVDEDDLGIKEFFILKSLIMSEDDSRYMMINHPVYKNEFSSRKALPTVFEIGKRAGSTYAEFKDENKMPKKSKEQMQNSSSVNKELYRSNKDLHSKAGDSINIKQSPLDDKDIEIAKQKLAQKFNTNMKKR